MLNHESGGIVWFNKERFEELSEWVILLLLLGRCDSSLSARALSARMGAAERAITQGAKSAQDVGYRSQLFVVLPVKVVIRRTPRVKKTTA
jgi:hypothetical protein